MPREKTELQKVAGKLISAIQKEWGDDLGEPYAEFSEDVMDRAHDILQAGTEEKAIALLGSQTVRQYLGEVWVQRHTSVKPLTLEIDELLTRHSNNS